MRQKFPSPLWNNSFFVFFCVFVRRQDIRLLKKRLVWINNENGFKLQTGRLQPENTIEIFYRNTYFKCRRWLSKAFLTPATFKNAFEGDTANTPGLCELKEKILIKRQRAKLKSNYIFGEWLLQHDIRKKRKEIDSVV